jgi:hypothetical protein
MASDKNTRPEQNDQGAFDDGDLPVKVAIGSYQEFERWIDCELRKLVACWIHTAAPNASAPSRKSSHLGKPK